MYTLSWEDPTIPYYFERTMGKTFEHCSVADIIAYASVLDSTSPSAPTSAPLSMPRRLI